VGRRRGRRHGHGRAMKPSDRIRARLLAASQPFRANCNISHLILPGELEELEAEVQARVADLLDALVIDRDTDHNTRDTAKRVAKMYLREVFRGRYESAPSTTSFPNIEKVDEVYTVGPIPVRSACSHHMVPIIGSAWVGVIPGANLIGLSKFNRLTQWIMSRPQIQEEAIATLADLLEAKISPRALAVVVKARHLCCQWRGVRDGSEMVSSIMRGIFKEDQAARAEFFSIIRSQGF
jgi:GTP cyclohydrolase IA